MLARREHSRSELERKLGARGFSSDLIAAALDQLESQGLLDDSRFTEVYVRQRVERGYGPLRIQQELRQRGIADDVAREQLASTGVDWQAQALALRRKRFGDAQPQDYNERARQARFLQQRGFSLNDLKDLIDT